MYISARLLGSIATRKMDKEVDTIEVDWNKFFYNILFADHFILRVVQCSCSHREKFLIRSVRVNLGHTLDQHLVWNLDNQQNYEGTLHDNLSHVKE